MKGIIYARQSSGKEEKSESIEAQIQNCRRLAETQNIDVVGVFSDANVSGKTYPKGGEEKEIIVEEDKVDYIPQYMQNFIGIEGIDYVVCKKTT